MADRKKISFGRVIIDPTQMRTVLIDQRTRLGLSHRALAEKAGVAPTTIYNLEQGSYKVQLDKFLAVLDALDLVPQDVLEIDGERTVPPATELEREVAALFNEEAPTGEILRRIADILDRSS